MGVKILIPQIEPTEQGWVGAWYIAFEAKQYVLLIKVWESEPGMASSSAYRSQENDADGDHDDYKYIALTMCSALFYALEIFWLI